MKTPRHYWSIRAGIYGNFSVFRCSRCKTERVPDSGTKSLYLYRLGNAKTPNGKPLGEAWAAFKAGVVPKCVKEAP